MTSRDIQDVVLRALCDGPFRHRLWDSPSPDYVQRIDRAGLERFARFLLRHYYRERIVHFFKYSRALAPLTGRKPEEVLKSDRFRDLAPTAVIGSFQTAADVAGLLHHHLLENCEPIVGRIPYWPDLVEYERAFFQADAQKTSEKAASEFPVRSNSATIIDLDWDIPSILPALLKPFDAPPMPSRTPIKLLIARSSQGRVSVIRCSDPLLRLLESMDGAHHLAALAERAGIGLTAAEQAVSRLTEIGAVDWAAPTKTV